MPELSRERILEWQKIFMKNYGVNYSYKEATEAANNLIGFFSLLLEIDQRNKQNKKKNVKHSTN